MKKNTIHSIKLYLIKAALLTLLFFLYSTITSFRKNMCLADGAPYVFKPPNFVVTNEYPDIEYAGFILVDSATSGNTNTQGGGYFDYDISLSTGSNSIKSIHNHISGIHNDIICSMDWQQLIFLNRDIICNKDPITNDYGLNSYSKL